jgi:hypothetical protein
MNLSSDELAILEYLKSWNGKYVTMIEICRCASGRQKFRESPKWANGLMARLVDAGAVEVNERGHYRWIDLANPPKPGEGFPLAAPSKAASIVGDNYFPATSDTPEPELARWVSPHIVAILKKSGKNFGEPK